MAPPTAQQLARELLHPTKQWHLVHCGDSRAVSLGRDLCACATEIAWSGCGLITMVAASPASHAAGYTAAVATGGLPVENPHLEGDNLSAWAATGCWSAVFTGEDAPASLASAVCYYGFTRAMFPIVYERLIAGGGAAKVRGLYRTNTAGIVGGDGVRLGIAANAAAYLDPFTPPSYFTDPITDTAGAGSLAVAEVSIPAGHDWATNDAPVLEWICEPSGANPAGLVFQAVDSPWVEAAGNGIVHHEHCMNGAQYLWWLDDDLNPAAKLTDHDGLYGENLIYWFSLGYNSRGHSVAESEANLLAVIARIRAAHPDAAIVTDTQYPGSDTGDSPDWAVAIRNVAAARDDVLLVDTCAVRTYAQADALGWIDDGIHYNETGKRQYARDIGDLVRVAAIGGSMAVIHDDDTRGDIAAAVLARIDGGSGAGKLVIRDGTTVIATLTLNDPSATRSGAVLTFAGFPKTDLACAASGTPDNALVTDSDDVTRLQLSVGVGTGDVRLPKADWVEGEPLKIESASYTAPV
jgi:hypothetical protein